MKNIINRLLKIVSSAIFIVLLLIIGVLIFYIVRVNFLASNDKLGDVKINVYTILTQSMYPTIKAGDVIVTYKEDNNRYNTGDIITFTSENNNGMTITHRVNEVFMVNNEYSYRTKGDNNNTPDSEIVKSDKILGRVVFKVPKAGFIQQFLISETGWIVAVVLPALGIVIYDILKVVLMVTGIKTGKAVTKALNNEDDERLKKARERLKKVVEEDAKEEK